jgi:hypothetical protein
MFLTASVVRTARAYALAEEHWSKVAVALHTGFRRANCFRLRWAEDVNATAGGGWAFDAPVPP